MQNTIEINLGRMMLMLIIMLVAFGLAAYFVFQRRLVLAVICFGFPFMLLRPSTALSAELCKPIRYADGDTFTFKRNGEAVRVRLAGYDALERGQPFSRRATERLRELTEAGAQCDCYKQDKYGRSVCTVRTKAGENVATEMLKAGFACIDPRFESEAVPADRAAARAALAEAQAQRRGMWSKSDPVCAVDFRKAKHAQ